MTRIRNPDFIRVVLTLGLFLAGRAPEIWAGVSAWVPISDLNAWYKESRRLGTKYVGEVAAIFDGAHDKNTEAAVRRLNRQRKSI